jgi:hypothetical protein
MNPTMNPTKLVIALALFFAAAGPCLAQSQPNYGPGGSSAGDTFGKPPSGSAAAQQAVQRHHHYHY